MSQEIQRLNVIDTTFSSHIYDQCYRPTKGDASAGQCPVPYSKSSLTQNNINVLPWSSQSPDLNPIEHLWKELDPHLNHWTNTVKYCNIIKCQRISKVHMSECKILNRSISRRCRAVLGAPACHNFNVTGNFIVCDWFFFSFKSLFSILYGIHVWKLSQYTKALL